MTPADTDQRELDSLRRFIDVNGDVKVLLENSASWADSQAEQAEKSRRTAWRVATAMGALAALCAVIALTTVIMSHQPAPPPQVLLADRSTGTVERLVSLTDFQETADDATIKRSITTFMRAREGYTYDTAEQVYFDAATFMSPPLQAQWAQFWDTGNPRSPLAVYKRDTKVRVELGAISINRDPRGKATSARVSFTRTLRQNDVAISGETAWLATMSFNFVNAPTQERARRVNDIGFQITDYQVDADIAAGTSPTPLPPPVKPAQALSAPIAPPALQASRNGANGVSR